MANLAGERKQQYELQVSVVTSGTGEETNHTLENELLGMALFSSQNI